MFAVDQGPLSSTSQKMQDCTPVCNISLSDYRGLSGDGYWSSAPDPRTAPLCAAADPTADYRWEARACGGPTVASFICELPGIEISHLNYLQKYYTSV